MSGFPVVLAPNATPVVVVAAGGVPATFAANGLGTPITPVETGAPPLVVSGLDLDAVELIARMDVMPDHFRVVAINALVAGLRSAGIWAKLDCLYLMAAADAQSATLNWKGPSNNLAAVGGMPSFVTDEGFTSNGTSQILTTGFIAGAGLCLRDDHHFSVWSRSAGQFNTAEIGADQVSITSRTTSDLFVSRSASLNTNTAANTTGAGLFAISRTGSMAYSQYCNGAVIGTPAEISVAFGGVYPIYVCGRNNAGTPAYSTKQIAMASIGGGLSDVDSAALYALSAQYMAAL